MPQEWAPVVEPTPAPAGWTRVPDVPAVEPHIGPDPDTGIVGTVTQLYRKAFPPERQRIDSNVLTVGNVGVAPEDLLIAGQAGRAIAGAAGSAVGAAGKVAAGAKEAVAYAAPAIKYEAVKHGLMLAGVPEGLASPIAMVLAGAKRGAASTETGPTTTRTPTAEAKPPSATEVSPLDYTRSLKKGAATSPVESASGGTPPPVGPPAAPAPSAPQTPARSAGMMSTTAIQSDLGIAARRMKLSLPPESPQAIQAESLVRQGLSIEDAVQAAVRTPASPSPSAPAMFADMSSAEVQAYTRLRSEGMPDAVARAEILKSRIAAERMNRQFGLKTPTEAETKFPKGMRGKVPAPKGSGS